MAGQAHLPGAGSVLAETSTLAKKPDKTKTTINRLSIAISQIYSYLSHFSELIFAFRLLYKTKLEKYPAA